MHDGTAVAYAKLGRNEVNVKDNVKPNPNLNS